MGCGKSKHAVATGNTVSKSKSTRSDSIKIENPTQDSVEKENVVVDAVKKKKEALEIVDHKVAVQGHEAVECETRRGEEKQGIKNEAGIAEEKDEDENLNSSDSPHHYFSPKRDQEEAHDDQAFSPDEISAESLKDDLSDQAKKEEELTVEEGKDTSAAAATVEETTVFAVSRDQEKNTSDSEKENADVTSTITTKNEK